MTNKEFLLAVASERDLYEHARKLVAIANEVRKYQLNDSLISYERLQEMVDNLEGDE